MPREPRFIKPLPPYQAGVLEFASRFGTEDACRKHLVKSRWPEGFVCPRYASHEQPYEMPARDLVEFVNCLNQVSPTAGTVMARTRVPLQHK